MNKTEYVKTIEKALVGHVSAQELHDTVAYYRDYIDMEIRKGKTEEEVLAQLGNPRLLAKTIIDAKGRSGQQETGGREYEQEISSESNTHTKGFRIPLAILILIVFVILGMIFGMIFSIARFLLPILLPVLIVFGLISLFKKK